MSGTDQARRAFFDRLAPTWDSAGPPPAATLARLDALRPLIPLRSGDAVLEVGCGTGAVTGWLGDQVRPGRVTAVDFAPAMIAAARARGVAADFACCDVLADELGAERYDAVFCMHVVPHLPDLPAALARFARALRPGGRLIVLHLDYWERINRFHDSLGPPVAGDHLPPPDAWPGLLRAAELTLATLEDREDLFLLTARR